MGPLAGPPISAGMNPILFPLYKSYFVVVATLLCFSFLKMDNNDVLPVPGQLEAQLGKCKTVRKPTYYKNREKTAPVSGWWMTMVDVFFLLAYVPACFFAGKVLVFGFMISSLHFLITAFVFLVHYCRK